MSGHCVTNNCLTIPNHDNPEVHIKKEILDHEIFEPSKECGMWNIDHQTTVESESKDNNLISTSDSTFEGEMKGDGYSDKVKTEADGNAGYSTDEHSVPLDNHTNYVKIESSENLNCTKEDSNASSGLVEELINNAQISCGICKNMIKKGVKIYRYIHMDNDQTLQYNCTDCVDGKDVNNEVMTVKAEVQLCDSASVVLPRNVKRFKCHICCNLYSRKETLDNHIDSVHYNLKKFKCTLCSNAFAKAVSLKTHIDSIHKGIAQPKFHCNECSAEFSSKQSMRAHIDVIHKNIKNFFCDKCDRGFYEKSKYVFHLNSVHKNVKKFKCEQCGYAAALQFILKNHIDIVHKKIKKFTCNLCNREFARSANLKGHFDAVHLKLRKFHCGECNFSALSRAALRKHDNARHKNITYDCDSCGKSFSFKQMMMRHIIAVHLKLKDYLCDDCGRAFASKGDLATHINVVHKLMRKYAHVCNECGRAFMKRNRLKKHIAQDHNVIMEDDVEAKMLVLNVLNV